jgi:hypothetical protein
VVDPPGQCRRCLCLSMSMGVERAVGQYISIASVMMAQLSATVIMMQQHVNVYASFASFASCARSDHLHAAMGAARCGRRVGLTSGRQRTYEDNNNSTTGSEKHAILPSPTNFATAPLSTAQCDTSLSTAQRGRDEAVIARREPSGTTAVCQVDSTCVRQDESEVQTHFQHEVLSLL